MSPESKYLRFFAPYPRLSERDVRRFTQVDYVDRVAFILTLGEEMIAVGRYDRTEDNQAEVAFLIEDAHQGRGIAQLLLEHLAEAARERGITRFVAEVLPQNRRMAQVFADAGYRMSKGIEDGVLNGGVPDPAHRHLGRGDGAPGAPGRSAPRCSGCSPRTGSSCYGKRRPGAGLVDSMLRGGFRGEIDRRLRRRHVTAVGVPTAPTLAEVPGRLDLALVSVPTAELGAVVIDVAHKGAHGIVVLTGSRRRARGQPDGDQPGPGVRGAGAGTRRARPDQHRAGGRAQRDARGRCRGPAGSGCSASRPRSGSRC